MLHGFITPHIHMQLPKSRISLLRQFSDSNTYASKLIDCLHNILTSLRQGGAFANQVEFSEARSENGYGF